MRRRLLIKLLARIVLARRARAYDALLLGLPLYPYIRHLRDLVIQAGISPGMRVLDVGCGTGNLLCALEALGIACEVVGIDNDGPALKQAWAKARRYSGSASFVQVDLDSPADWGMEGHFDVIFCVGSLYAVKEPVAVLERLRCLAGVGATLVLSTLHASYEPSFDGILRAHLRAVEEQRKSIVDEVARFCVGYRTVNRRTQMVDWVFGISRADSHFPDEAELQAWLGTSGWSLMRDLVRAYGDPPRNLVAVCSNRSSLPEMR